MRRGTIRRAALAAAAVVALALAGCATDAGNRSGYDEETTVSDITGEWQLTKGSDADGAWNVNGTPVTLVLADGAVSGQAPCNVFGGDLTVDGPDIGIGSISHTMMACDDDARNQLETRYLQALEKVTTAKVGGAAELRTLTLSGPDETLRFTIVEKKAAN
jgi:heat shock protein HslJ